MTVAMQMPLRPLVRRPLATPEETAAEPAAFPLQTEASPCESAFVDWRERLTRNLSRRSTSRWEPLTYVHADPDETR